MPGWMDTIQRAFFDAWIDNDVMPDKEREVQIDAFQQRWQGLDVDSFQRALQEGNEADRLCALFALGYLAPASREELLVPFLFSPLRKERWASAIALGKSRDERAFVPLQQLLTEERAYFLPHTEKDLMSIWLEAMEKARERFGDSSAWERLVHPDLVQAWHEQEAYRSEYTWYLIHRSTIASLLGTWGDPRAVPALRQALQMYWEIEQLPPYQGLPGGSLETVHHLEDELAYALGRLEAWKALDGLEELGLPPSRWKLARLYLVLGSLQVNLHSLYNGNITLLIDIGIIDPDRVVAILQERFGLNKYLAQANLDMFQQWYQERNRK